ncbi:MAG: hypothetical protein QXV17_10605, partial [Candidatus Micrarchaeaceae archaeon]
MGHKEIFLSFSKDGMAFWIRYLISKGNKRTGSFMIAMFSGETASGMKNDYNDYFMNLKGETRIGGNVINILEGTSKGENENFDLKWSGNEEMTNAISGIARFMDLRSRYILISPNSTFNGYVEYSGKHFSVQDYKGMVGYISQPDYLKQWSWMHMSG